MKKITSAILAICFALITGCAQNASSETEIEVVREEIPVTPQYFFGSWINMYLVEATTRKDTLTEMTTYVFKEDGTYDSSKNVSDRWAVNQQTKSFFLYYSEGTTYAEFEIEIISSEEFNLRRVYVDNLFIYNFKKTN